jgi:hypothetical protein
MQTLIERLRKSLVRKQREAIEDGFPQYRELLRRIVEEDPAIDPTEVSTILESNGLTIDDLERDSETFRKRLEWSHRRSDAQVARKEYDAEARVLDGLNEELRKAKETLGKKIRETSQRMQAIHHRITSGAVDGDLVRTCLDPALRNRVTEIDGEVRDKLAAIDAIRSRVDVHAASIAESRVQKWERHDRDNWGRNTYVRKQLDYWRNVFATFTEQKTSREEIISELEAEVRRLNQEREQVSERMLAP